MGSSEKGRGKGSATGRKRRGRSRRERILRVALLSIAAVILLFVVGVTAVYAFARIPEPSDIARVQSVSVVDRDGDPIGRIHADADRVSIPLRDMPEHAREAVIATEDKRFYKHAGVSLISIARAAVANVAGGGIEQGGSTITQQYVKNAFVGRERTFLRKTREAVLALKLERQRSKDEILELYLNTIYFGRGAYGLEAASQAYFAKHAKRLTLAEAALLAGLIRSPEAYDPVKRPEEANARRDEVLGLMRAQGMISDKEEADAKRRRVRARPRAAGGSAPHFLEEVRRFLEKEIGPAKLYGGDVTVRSTLDDEMQEQAEAAVRAVYDRRRDPEAALVAIDPATGGVRAMVGARDFARRQLNLAERRRQPGSTFKPFVLAAAVEDGISPEDEFPGPARRVFQTDGDPWPVTNYDERDHGRLTLRRATELSVNTVYARVILKVGPDKVAERAQDLGIERDLPALPALALGAVEVSPLEMASAYATLAARGEYHRPYLVEKVTKKDDVLYEAKPEAERSIDRNDADIVNDVLQGVIENGTGVAADIGRPAAGKTGTTDDFRDAWFAGYTPDLATVVWNGFADGKKKLRGVRGRNVTGGSFPAQMWRRFMVKALEGVDPTPFPEPEIEDGEDDESPEPTKSERETPDVETPKPSATKTKDPEETPKPKPTKKVTPTATASPAPTDSPSS